MNRGTPFALLWIALLTITATAHAGNWTGKETTKEGVIHVTNPATPSDGKSSIVAQELWRAGGDDEEVIFGVLSDVAMDSQGNLYALDAQLSAISVFDPDGNFLRTIGREGEGPGEFRRASQLFVTPENKIAVAQMMPGKIVLLTPDGKPAGDFPMPEAPGGGMQMLWDVGAAGRSVVIGLGSFAQSENKMTRTSALQILAPDGTVRAKLAQQSSIDDMANMNFDEKTARRPVWTASADGSVFLNDNFDVYEIKYHGADGKLARVSTREYTHRSRSKEEMEEGKPRIMMRSDRGSRRFDSTASPTDPDVLAMFARADGTLWVMSSRGARDCPKGTMARFDVFDAKGHYVREVTVQGDASFARDGIMLVDDQLVVLKGLRSAQRAMMAAMGTDDAAEVAEEAEPMAIVCYRLDPQPTANN